jgi:hypothetical protein
MRPELLDVRRDVYGTERFGRSASSIAEGVGVPNAYDVYIIYRL